MTSSCGRMCRVTPCDACPERWLSVPLEQPSPNAGALGWPWLLVAVVLAGLGCWGLLDVLL